MRGAMILGDLYSDTRIPWLKQYYDPWKAEKYHLDIMRSFGCAEFVRRHACMGQPLIYNSPY